jgi:hypothetical protein
MRNRRSIDALSIGGILVALGIAVFSVWSIPPRFNAPVYSDIGKILARQALAILPSGGEVTIIARDLKTYPQPAMEITLRDFQKEISRAGVGVTMKSIQLDPLRPVEVPPGDFYEAIRRSKANQVIVSLLGPPVLEPEQRAKLSGAKPKIVAFCTGSLAEQIDLRELLQSGLLHAAIINKQGPGSSGESFDQLYTLIQKAESSATEAKAK